MAYIEYPGYEICWLQLDGSFTYSPLKAETDDTFLDYGNYLIPTALVWGW